MAERRQLHQEGAAILTGRVDQDVAVFGIKAGDLIVPVLHPGHFDGGASEERAAAGTDPGHAGDVARAIVDEARTRRSFTEPEEPRHGLRGRLGAIAGRGEGGPIDALREAVQQAQQ